MTFSYKDPVILFSDFSLDWINVQSDNPIRFDWWIIQKKRLCSKCHSSNVEIFPDVKISETVCEKCTK